MRAFPRRAAVAALVVAVSAAGGLLHFGGESVPEPPAGGHGRAAPCGAATHPCLPPPTPTGPCANSTANPARVDGHALSGQRDGIGGDGAADRSRRRLLLRGHRRGAAAETARRRRRAAVRPGHSVGRADLSLERRGLADRGEGSLHRGIRRRRGSSAAAGSRRIRISFESARASWRCCCVPAICSRAPRVRGAACSSCARASSRPWATSN
ncbi:MAG: hypothetical protein MZW92_20000 [Comamonadaceae bacterium]|nr:hypothetical protein [Comamonadaceae bacterium]